MNAILRPFAGPALAGALVLALAPAAAAQVVIPAPAANAPPDPFQTYAGTYLSDCTNSSSARLTVVGGVLTYIDAERRVSGARILALASDGSAPPVTDDRTLVGEVPANGMLRFVVHKDASGEYIQVEGDPGVLDALGPDARRLQFRRCDTAIGSAPASVTPTGRTTTAVVTATAMMTDPKFKTAYTKTLGFRARDPWLSTLEGPSPATRTVKIDNRNYVLVSSCKEHDCNNRNVVLLYSAAKNVVYGKLYEAGTIAYLGSPPAAVARQLDVLWKDTWRPQP